jgi:hypothetical protein
MGQGARRLGRECHLRDNAHAPHRGGSPCDGDGEIECAGARSRLETPSTRAAGSCTDWDG